MGEASTYLNALLKRDPENALANLGEARMAAEQGKTADAAKFYRRAIDGTWPAGQDQNRMQARFELASLMEKAGQRTQAIAELLAALGPAAHDTTVKNKIGQLLLSYGAPREAADVFRNMAQPDDRDSNAFAGLGAADLAMENYQDASNALQKALQLNPADEASKTQLELSERVLALDPNARGLRAAERYKRSKELLQAEVRRFDQCQPGNAAADQARKALANEPRPRELEDSADVNLALAEDLWKQQKTCAGGHAPSSNDQAIERVLSRLSKK